MQFRRAIKRSRLQQ